MLNFSQWLLNESFELPFRVIKDIYEFYKSVINEDEEDWKKRRQKIFKIDFTGTNFEFLNKLNANLKVLIGYEYNYLLRRDDIRFGAHGLYQHIIYANPIYGTIILPMVDIKDRHEKDIYDHVVISTIEHEVLHFVQDLIKEAKNLEHIGGLPSPKFVKRIKDKEGIDSDYNDKRVSHHKRPIEFYTNMNSLINYIQYNYLYWCSKQSYDLDYCQKDKDMKKNYLNRQISFMKKNERYNFDQEYFRMLLKSAYKRFIDNDDFLSKYYHIFDDENFEYTTTYNGKEYKQKGSYFA